jgi:hypothetical protein
LFSQLHNNAHAKSGYNIWNSGLHEIKARQSFGFQKRHCKIKEEEKIKLFKDLLTE